MRAVRASEGTTTEVYRVSRGGAVLYVRLAEDAGGSMEAEAWAHQEIRRLGGRVPEVIAVEPPGGRAGRGVLVTGAVAGRALAGCRSGRHLPAVLREAGRDAARIGSIEVDGFGFVDRDRPVPPLRAPLASAAELLLDPPPRRRAGVLEPHLPLLDGPARLAHGDLDATHVFASGSRYRGIIDLGEIRGAPPLYDLGHWALHEAMLPAPSLPHLLAGWAEVAPLPDDHMQRIALLGVLIGLDRQRRRVDAAYAGLIGDGIERLARSPALA